MDTIMTIAASARSASQRSGTLALLGLAVLALGPLGCGTGSEATQPLSPEAFVTSPGEDRGIGNPLDKPGPVQYDNYRLMQPAPARRPTNPPVTVVGRTVRDSVQSPEAEARREEARLNANDGSATQPTTLPGGTAPSSDNTGADQTGTEAVGLGRYYVVGDVLMEVNGTGIFSDKVVNAIEKPLSAEAKLRGPAGFRDVAAQQLDNQIHVYERDELEYASAQRSLEAEDEQVARAMTVQWRQKKITEAGGSPELARRRAAADGWDFDKLVEQQYRLHLVQIFYQKRVIPQIQVSQTDMRTYYELHKDAEFTTHGQAKFRVIKVDPSTTPASTKRPMPSPARFARMPLP